MSARKDDPKSFQKELEAIWYRHDVRRVFDGFTTLAACAVSGQTREAEYLEEAKRWSKEELGGFARAMGALVLEMEQSPFTDLLGGYYMEFILSKSGQKWNCEFHTPQPICRAMVRMTLDSASFPESGVFTALEPACGSGAMILALGESVTPEQRRRLRVTAIDISKTACDMCFINTTLWGIPAQIIHGNTLSLETWAQWTNLHWRMPWLPLAMRPRVQEQGEPPAPEIVKQLAINIGHQQELEFA